MVKRNGLRRSVFLLKAQSTKIINYSLFTIVTNKTKAIKLKNSAITDKPRDAFVQYAMA